MPDKLYESDAGGVHYLVESSTGLPGSKPDSVEQEADRWTVDRLWTEYQAANPALKGMSVYRAIYNAHLNDSFGARDPASITAFDLDRLKLEGMRGRAPKTIANALELLRRIVNFGVRRGLCEAPRCGIQLPRVTNEKTEDLTWEELSRLIEVIDAQISLRISRADGAAMMKLVLLTGMRRGEIFRLKWADLDFHRNNILLREPKGGCDVVIPMSSHARRLLETLRTQRNDEQRAASKSSSPTDLVEDQPICSPYVFPGKDGGQRRDVRAQVNAIKAEAGLPCDFRPLHGLRHVFASNLISNGVEFQLVQRLLTHKGGTVTHRYAHIRDDALRAAAELAGQLAGCFPAKRE